MTTRIQLRRGLAAAWTAANPTLAAGEAGVEMDTGKLKLGDGATAWAALPYFADPDPVTTVTYNPDGSVANVTENGTVTSYTYNGDGTVATHTRAGVTRTYSYTAGNLTGVS